MMPDNKEAEDVYSTFVFWHANQDEAKALTSELFARFPFGPNGGPTRITAVTAGDAMRVADAIRMALECQAIDMFERRDFALELSDQVSWEQCLKIAEKWELRLEQGEFVDARTA